MGALPDASLMPSGMSPDDCHYHQNSYQLGIAAARSLRIVGMGETAGGSRSAVVGSRSDRLSEQLADWRLSRFRQDDPRRGLPKFACCSPQKIRKYSGMLQPL